MTDAEVHADGLEQLEELQPATFSWNNTQYACLAGSTGRRRDLGFGGLGNETDAILFVRTVLFADERPQTKEIISYGGRQLRIDEIVTPAGSPFLKLICVDKNRRA